MNLAELLKEASYGMELYSTIFGVVYLKGVSDNTTIAVYDKNQISRYFNKYGQYFDDFPDAECQLFPAKGQSWDDWKHAAELAIHKFKIGDWIIHNDGSSYVPVQIYNLKKDRYLVTNMLGSKGEVMLTSQDKWRLWSINDAKPGDILNANGAVFIYKKHNKDYVYHYCGINLVYEFVIDTDDSVWNINNKIYPATQEQKDLLFNKIKEAGYTWDLNSNTLYSKTLTKKTKFKIGDWIISKEKDRFYQITDIRGKKYFYNNTVKYDYINIADDLYDLWTIDDAKPGDILMADGAPFMYKDHNNNYVYYYCGINLCDEFIVANLSNNNSNNSIWHNNNGYLLPATQEECDRLFRRMEDFGYMWDSNKKKLKKRIDPKFEEGDKITDGNTELIINRVRNDSQNYQVYECNDYTGLPVYFLSFKKQDKWTLVSKDNDHYEIKNFRTGMPVLVRSNDECTWDYSIFSHITENKNWPFAVCNGVCFTQCIPFDDNEELCGTSNPCKKKYINW